ncbi:MAG TPA: sodium:solute symporter family protein [Bacteroidota bacterium]|nr:sodium:solute symporter family protein [Bacteroidota bacterium]
MNPTDPVLHFATGDAVVLVAYAAAVLGAGWLAVRRQRGSGVTEYLLAGRSLTVPLFVMTLVSTWYGGILGVGEFTYSYGIANWVIQGIPYYVFALLFAFLLAGKIRASSLTTIPDRLEQAYDRRTALLGAGLTFLLMTPAPYVLMLGILLQMITGWSLPVCVVAGTIVTTGYLFAGGFRADVYTDVLEFVLMFAGFGLIIPFAVSSFGGWDVLSAHLPPLHLTFHGGHSAQFILVWFFIALWTLVDPAFYQRCAAAESGAVARKGILWSILFWIIFDMMTVTVGLYARAILPPLGQPVMAYPMLAEHLLPPVAKGLFFTGLIATIMSTLNTLAFVSGTTLGRDVVLRLRRRGGFAVSGGVTDRIDGQTGTGRDPHIGTVSDHHSKNGTDLHAGDGRSYRTENGTENPAEKRWVQAGLLMSAMLAVVLALSIPSVVKLWYTIGTVIVPGLLIPLVSTYFPSLRVGARAGFSIMLGGWLTSSVWLLAGWTRELGVSENYPFGIEPMYPGLAVSLLLWLRGRMIRS